MVKAKEFWQHICVDLRFKLFSGFPCRELAPIYDAMDSSIMHYIPATAEDVALGIINGFWFTGQRGAVLMDSGNLYKLFPMLFKINIVYKIPSLIIVPGICIDLPEGIISAKMKGNNLKKLVAEAEEKGLPAVLDLGGKIE